MTGLSRPTLWLGASLILGAALRGLYLLTPTLDSDQAIVGLMGRHVLQGEFPIFFWGQPFAGTMESYLAALLFFLFGSSRLTLALSPFLFSLGFLLVTYRLAREACDREVGLLALLLAALPAPFLVVHSVTARSNYIQNLLLGSLVLCLTLRVPRREGAQRWRGLFLLGFFGGLAWYESPQSIHYLLTSGVFLLLREPRLLGQRAFWALPPAFLLGSLPFWVYELRAPFTTFLAMYAQAGHGGGPGRSLVRYLGEKFPYVVGVVERGGALELSAALLVLALYGLAFLHLFRRWRSGANQVMLLFLLITSAVIVLGYNQGGSPRYLLPLYSVLPIMMAAFLATVRRLSAPLFAIALAGLLVGNVAGNVARAEVLDATKLALSRWELARDARLVDFLRGDGLTRVYALDFWDAYRLTFDARESVVFAEANPGFYPPFTQLVDTAERYGYVVKGSQTVRDFEENLRSVGGRYRKREVVGYTVFDAFVPPAGPPPRPLSRGAWQATASHARAETGKAFDRDPLTRWWSGPAEGLRPYYQVDLAEVRVVEQIALLPGRPQDALSAFRVEGSPDGERWETALAFSGRWRGLAWVGSRLSVDPTGWIDVRVRPIRARWVRIVPVGRGETGWSIAELFASEPTPPDTRALPAPGRDAFLRGLQRRAEGNRPDALRAFQEAVDRDPDWGEPHAQLLLAYQQLGIDAESFYERAEALDRLGLGDLAARALWKAVEVFPHSSHTDPLLRLLRSDGARGNPAEVDRLKQRLGAFVPAERLQASFGGKLRLLGYTIDRHEVEAGSQVRLSYFWECLAEMREDYVVFVHLRGDGTTLGDDHAPLEGLYPTSRWRKGEVIREDRVLSIPGAVAPGPLTLLVGVWEPRSGQRLGVDDGRTGPKGDRVELLRLVITRRSVTP